MRVESFSSVQDLPQLLRRDEVDRPLRRLRDIEVISVLQINDETFTGMNDLTKCMY
jgi:hypothetical protein